MEASLTTDPDNEDLNKLKKDLQVSQWWKSPVLTQGVSWWGWELPYNIFHPSEEIDDCLKYAGM